ncbi:hypothetical protein BDA99DRAFT_606323 [Phascolomyces articulosus]|uniref:Uncharacterized protein n=1 Tax=Phascolomyces articulosus TaxID=60185 RepID=A0AAD5JX22_9FUNG|nr:hypothetical protein BDA99DRAFT_606323 [Phascolomyces articulosus]
MLSNNFEDNNPENRSGYNQYSTSDTETDGNDIVNDSQNNHEGDVFINIPLDERPNNIFPRSSTGNDVDDVNVLQQQQQQAEASPSSNTSNTSATDTTQEDGGRSPPPPLLQCQPQIFLEGISVDEVECKHAKAILSHIIHIDDQDLKKEAILAIGIFHPNLLYRPDILDSVSLITYLEDELDDDTNLNRAAERFVDHRIKELHRLKKEQKGLIRVAYTLYNGAPDTPEATNSQENILLQTQANSNSCENSPSEHMNSNSQGDGLSTHENINSQEDGSSIPHTDNSNDINKKNEEALQDLITLVYNTLSNTKISQQQTEQKLRFKGNLSEYSQDPLLQHALWYFEQQQYRTDYLERFFVVLKHFPFNHAVSGVRLFTFQ